MTSRLDGIGIDLGATSSIIAVAQGADARPIAARDGVEGVPSVVYFDRRDDAPGTTKVVGQEALVRLLDDPDNVAMGFIAELGSATMYDLPSGERLASPEELAAEVLRSLRFMARRKTGHDVKTAMLAVPVAFDASQRKALSRAALLAGFSAIDLVEAPVAAAVAAAQSAGPVTEEALWLVYDWGGTTFEASLLRFHANRFEVIASLGNKDLGADLVDWAIVERRLVPVLLKQYNLPNFTRRNRRWAQAFGMMRAFAEAAKIELSSGGCATIEFKELFRDDDGAAVSLTCDLRDDELDRLVSPYVGRTMARVGRLLEERGLGPNDLDRVVPVGGFCHNALVRRRLHSLADAAARGMESGVDPVSVVACGAALLAGPPEPPRPAAAAEPLPEVEAAGEADTAAAATAAESPVPVEGAAGRPEDEAAAEPAEAAEPLPEAEAAGEAEAAAEAAAPVEEPPGDLPPAPRRRHGHGYGFPRDAAVGILHGDDSVEWVFEIGEPVPTPRRRVSCLTVADLQAGSDQALRVPVVRGSGRVRYSVVGAAVISAEEVSADLPSGSKIVLGIKLDEEYRLTVSAYLPATKDVWDEALKLGYAEAYPDELPAEEEQPVTPGVADVTDESAGEQGAEVAVAPAEDEHAPAEDEHAPADEEQPVTPGIGDVADESAGEEGAEVAVAPADEEQPVTPGVADVADESAGEEGAEVAVAPAEDEHVPAEEPGLVAVPTVSAPEPGEWLVVPVDTPEPETSAPPAAEEETQVPAETPAFYGAWGFPTTPTTQVADPEPFQGSVAELPDASAVKSADGMDVPAEPAPPREPEPDSDWVDPAGPTARIEAQADEMETADAPAAAAYSGLEVDLSADSTGESAYSGLEVDLSADSTGESAYSGLEVDLSAGAKDRRPFHSPTDEEILRKARGFLLANEFEEAAHEAGRLGNSEAVLPEALDVLARVRLHQGHLDVAKSLWIQADELRPGVERYAEGLELVAEARNRRLDRDLRRRRTVRMVAVGLITCVILLVVIAIGVHACNSGGPVPTPAGGSPSPTSASPSTSGAVRENPQPSSHLACVWGTREQPTITVVVPTFTRGFFVPDSAGIARPGRV